MKYFKFLFTLLFALILFYEYNSIFQSLPSYVAEVENKILYMLSVWIMLIVTFLLFSNNRSVYRGNHLSKLLSYFIIYIFFINIISSLLLGSGLPSMTSPALWLLPLFIYRAMYVATARWYNINKLITFFTILFGVLIFAYIISYDMASLMTVSHDDSIALISSYFCMYVLPLVLCTDKKITKYISIVVVVVVIISSVKRTGAVALALGLVAYLFLQTNPFSSSKKSVIKKLAFVLIMLFSIFGIFYLFENSQLTLFNRLAGLSEDGGSGRDVVYAKVWQMIVDQDIVGFVFGNGYNAVALDTKMGMGAHNDFLEVMYDYGIIGLFLYLSLHFVLIKYVIRLSKSNSKYAAPMGMSYVLFLCASTFSQIVIYPYFMLIFFMSWAFFMSARNRELLSENNE